MVSMRFTCAVTVLCVVLGAAMPMAQEAGPSDPPAAAGEWTGPVVRGRHRQPSQAEVEARQRAEGASAKAIEKRSREQDQVIDELYKELMTPVPSSERSGEQGQSR